MGQKTSLDVPYNATPKTQRYWEDFVTQTLAGNVVGAVKAYHEYAQAKENILNAGIEQ